jgi:magnesium transporter
MKKFSLNRSKKSGLPPGTLVHIGKKRSDEVKIKIIDYDENKFVEKEIKNIEECFNFMDNPTVTWINIDGIHKIDIIERIGKHFNMHPLILEDIVNTDQRPKTEDYGNYLFVILKMLYLNGNKDEIESEQVSLIIGKNFVISFQEDKERDVFEQIRQRIRTGKGKIRKMGPDYLAYTLMDAIVDNYFVILETLSETIEELEEEVISNPSPKTSRSIHSLKSEMIFLRRCIWPLREVVRGLELDESVLIKEETKLFFRDVYDHTIQVIDNVETFRDVISGMVDVYLSSVSNKMNEIMKVLTIFSTIFIPLTFIVGVYGMNFKYLPELEWKYSYPVLWAIMLSIGIGMLIYFRKKKWI